MKIFVKPQLLSTLTIFFDCKIEGEKKISIAIKSKDKKYEFRDNEVILSEENKTFRPIDVTERQDFVCYEVEILPDFGCTIRIG